MLHLLCLTFLCSILKINEGFKKFAFVSDYEINGLSNHFRTQCSVSSHLTSTLITLSPLLLPPPAARNVTYDNVGDDDDGTGPKSERGGRTSRSRCSRQCDDASEAFGRRSIGPLTQTVSVRRRVALAPR